MIEVQRECRKPLIIVAIPGYERNLSQQFCRAGIPFFESAERAMRIYDLSFAISDGAKNMLYGGRSEDLDPNRFLVIQGRPGRAGREHRGRNRERIDLAWRGE